MPGDPMQTIAHALDRPALAIARSLEEGRLDGAAARLLARAWAPIAARSVVRALALPRGVRVVAVGGATLGGSGKTPLAVACARVLAGQGARVVLVGHAYRARPGRARVVATGNLAADVGDEALVSARALSAVGVPVVVAPSRAGAVAFAAGLGDVLVLDGVLQTAPVRASLALLAVDAGQPWGAGHVPPRGDLRAPIGALLAAADAVVTVGDDGEARATSGGAWLDGALVGWDELARRRVGLACALARPSRLLGFLHRRGVVPVAVVRARDHGVLVPRSLDDGAGVDLWLATAKCASACALHLPAWTGSGAPRAPRASRALRAPVATIDYDVVPAPSLAARLAAALAP